MNVRASVLIFSLAFAAACAVNPATGRRELSLVSEGQEIAMGREADGQVTTSLGLVDDAELQAYVGSLGARLAAVSERPALPWSFKVVDDPIVNAFALPGGFIYVTRGILAAFDSEAELAGVLGHEIGHVTARHSVSQMSRQQLQQIGLGIGMVLSENVRQYGGLVGANLQLLNLSYSRGDETQSDELGLRYISRLSYDPESMIGVFQMLGQVSGGGEGRIPEWQLTHPYPENREENIRLRIQEAGLATGGRVARAEFLDQLDGLVYGENPREGYFRDAQFLHPELEFELRFPAGWSTVNQRSVVAAIAPAEDAVIALQLVADAQDPATELRTFLGQEGVTGGTIREESAGGVRRARATFQATSQDGDVRGEVSFQTLDGRIYRVMGYSSPAQWGSYASEVGSTITSLSRLTDAAVLSVQPWRIDIRTAPSAMSLRTFATSNPSPVELEALARMNRRDPSEVLDAGTRIKWVVGRALP